MPITFHTDRLTLTPFAEADLAQVHRMFTDPFVRKYLWDDIAVPEDQVADILRVNDMLMRKRRFGLWKILRSADQQAIGFAGLWYFFEEPLPQLIYGLMPDFTGEGFATEAAAQIVDYAFGELDFPRLLAATDPPNTASSAVLARLGMTHLETVDKAGKPTEVWELQRSSRRDSAD